MSDMERNEIEGQQALEESQQPLEQKPSKRSKIIAEILEYVKMIVVVALVVYLLAGVILINAKIPSASMENTIMTKDRIFGFRMAYGINLDFLKYDLWTVKMKDPERFDIVIFRYPDNEDELFIKRIIGMPGEKVMIVDGKVYINDSPTPLDDSFIREPMRGSYGPFQVPEGCYFMLGDNRNNSRDSRFWDNTYVTFDQIVGKALFRYFPTPKLLGYKGEE